SHFSLCSYFAPLLPLCFVIFFFFHATATTEIYTLSLHDALPIYRQGSPGPCGGAHQAEPGCPDAAGGCTGADHAALALRSARRGLSGSEGRGAQAGTDQEGTRHGQAPGRGYGHWLGTGGLPQPFRGAD